MTVRISPFICKSMCYATGVAVIFLATALPLVAEARPGTIIPPPATEEQELLSLPPLEEAAGNGPAAPASIPTPAPSTDKALPASTTPSEEVVQPAVPQPRRRTGPRMEELEDATAAPSAEAEAGASPVTDRQPLTAPETEAVPSPISAESATQTGVTSEAVDAVPPVSEATEAGVSSPQADGSIIEVQPNAPTSVIPHVTWQGTLMFRPTKVENLLTLYKAYQNSRSKQTAKTQQDEAGVDVSELLEQIEGQPTAAEVPEEVLNVTLNSILYYNPKDWSIWLNGVRYFRDDALSGMVLDRSTLRVLSASEREINLLWVPLPTSQGKVQQYWQEKRQLAEAKDAAPSPFIAKDERIWLDEQSNVHITLKPHQTFVSQLMSVLEGVNIESAIAQRMASEQEKPVIDATTVEPVQPQSGNAAPVGDKGGFSINQGQSPAMPSPGNMQGTSVMQDR